MRQGADIARCGVCKLFDAQGVGGFTKWACLSDFAMTKSLHIAMRRYRTSSAGDDRCDFRLKSPPRLTRNQSRD